MPNEPQKWEIWYAMVYYEDEPTIGKKRPVVVYDNETVFIISYKVTGQMPKGYRWEYTLSDWEREGLDIISTVLLNRQLKIYKHDLVCKIGTLTTRDMIKIKCVLMDLDTQNI